MTPIEVEVRNTLLALSGLEQNQVAFGTVPRGSGLPYIALAKINADRGRTHDGADGSANSLMQANIYASGYQEAKQLAMKCYAFQAYTSDKIAGVALVDEVDGFDNTVDRHSTGLDFMVYHYE